MDFQAYTLEKHNEWACIQIKAPESETRTPVHLCCVIDTSASMMSENKLKNVKQSLCFLLDFLGPQDSISVITFSESARTILSQTFVSFTEKQNIRTRISFIQVESNTNISAGIIQSRETLMIDTTNTKQGILLLTDGVANMGLINSKDILELVRNTMTKFSGTSISSVGYGSDHNVELLQSISTEGGGSYYVVNNIEDVANVFGDILGGLVSCISQQVRVILPNNTEVKSRYAKHSTSDGQIEIVIGDIPSGMEAAFLAKIPYGSSVTLKGFNVHTHDMFEYNTTVINTDNIEISTNGEAHYLRFEVLTLLDESRALANKYTQIANINIHIDKIKACIITITEHQAEHTHSLWSVLLDELNNCKETLENRHHISNNTPQLMSQHAVYLGCMRGLPATLHPVISNESENCDDPAIPISHVFSNCTQRQISSQLYRTVTEGIVHQQNEPQNNTEPIRYLFNNSICTIPPLPPGPLRRQVAYSEHISRSTSIDTNN